MYLSFVGSGDVKSIGFPRGTLLFANFHVPPVQKMFCYCWDGAHGFRLVLDSEMSEEQKAELIIHVMEKKERENA